jgi:hypothetical protein
MLVLSKAITVDLPVETREDAYVILEECIVVTMPEVLAVGTFWVTSEESAVSVVLEIETR